MGGRVLRLNTVARSALLQTIVLEKLGYGQIAGCLRSSTSFRKSKVDFLKISPQTER
jgi:hypothetical protein